MRIDDKLGLRREFFGVFWRFRAEHSQIEVVGKFRSCGGNALPLQVSVFFILYKYLFIANCSDLMKVVYEWDEFSGKAVGWGGGEVEAIGGSYKI